MYLVFTAHNYINKIQDSTMIHKRAYYRGLLKVADIRPVSMPQYAPVGRSTRRLVHQDYDIAGKKLTYGDLGFTN